MSTEDFALSPWYQGLSPWYRGLSPWYQGLSRGYQGLSPWYQGLSPWYQGLSPWYQGLSGNLGLFRNDRVQEMTKLVKFGPFQEWLDPGNDEVVQIWAFSGTTGSRK